MRLLERVEYILKTGRTNSQACRTKQGCGEQFCSFLPHRFSLRARFFRSTDGRRNVAPGENLFKLAPKCRSVSRRVSKPCTLSVEVSQRGAQGGERDDEARQAARSRRKRR